MAIDWEIKFIRKETGHYSAVFRRFDTEAPDVTLNTVNIGDAILKTPEQKTALWDLVFKQYEKQPVPDATVAKLESDGRTALVGKEN